MRNLPMQLSDLLIQVSDPFLARGVIWPEDVVDGHGCESVSHGVDRCASHLLECCRGGGADAELGAVKALIDPIALCIFGGKRGEGGHACTAIIRRTRSNAEICN